MEFLRFGSTIPGTYWGCCACDIIQNFKVDPDAKASIQIVGGDGGMPLGDKFAGKTYREIFWSRIRFGTFDTRDMPNHGFIAIITENQINGEIGYKWLQILREAGFEFIRTITNSVYTGQDVVKDSSKTGTRAKNYVFGLFRNIGNERNEDPFTPPQKWQDLPKVTPEAWERLSDTKALANEQFDSQLASWNALALAKFYTEAQLEKDGVPVYYAGVRSEKKQQTKSERQAIVDREKAKVAVSKPADPLAAVPVPAASVDPFADENPTDVGSCGEPGCQVCT